VEKEFLNAESDTGTLVNLKGLKKFEIKGSLEINASKRKQRWLQTGDWNREGGNGPKRFVRSFSRALSGKKGTDAKPGKQSTPPEGEFGEEFRRDCKKEVGEKTERNGNVLEGVTKENTAGERWGEK